MRNICESLITAVSGYLTLQHSRAVLNWHFNFKQACDLNCNQIYLMDKTFHQSVWS